MSAAAASLLIVAQNEEIGNELEATLSRRGFRSRVIADAKSAVAELQLAPRELVLLVLPLPDVWGSEAIEHLRSVQASLPIIVLGADDTLGTAEQAVRLGVQEHLPNPPFAASEILAAVGGVLGSRQSDRRLEYLRSSEARQATWQSLMGESRASRELVAILQQLCARGGAPTILISGETGTGKGFIAKCIHHNGARRNRSLVEVNCAALPPSIIEAELFGYERGSFTDAKTQRVGLFEAADGGTLFLDEIGAVPIELQAKLLTAIEEKKIRRIGGRGVVHVDVQIIAATHEDLVRRIREGAFREDLYHRLNVIAVRVPPLRERGRDVLLLAQAMLRSLCGQYDTLERTLSPGAQNWMLSYAWPGNVRELRNLLERIVLLEDEEVIGERHVTRSALKGDGAVLFAQNNGSIQVSLPPTGVAFAELEREILREALAQCDGNVSRAARYLAITRQALIYRMKKYGLTSGPEAPKALPLPGVRRLSIIGRARLL
jgi:two-component system, NtrC family, response regulator AtoC